MRVIFISIIIAAAFADLVAAESVSNLTIGCTQQRLVVKGDSISIADVIGSAECWSKAKQIDIYALNAVIFDDDIDKRDQNVNLTIISPTWEIVPFLTKNQTQRRILLSAHREFNFMGLCLTKINGDQLQFHVDGAENQTNIYSSGNDHSTNFKNRILFFMKISKI